MRARRRWRRRQRRKLNRLVCLGSEGERWMRVKRWGRCTAAGRQPRLLTAGGSSSSDSHALYGLLCAASAARCARDGRSWVISAFSGPQLTRSPLRPACSYGLDSLLLRTSPSLKHFLAEPLAPVIASLVKSGSFTHLAAPHDSVGKNVFPRVAGILDVQQVSKTIHMSRSFLARPPRANASGSLRSRGCGAIAIAFAGAELS